jgi:biopolymer transport protein ExbB
MEVWLSGGWAMAALALLGLVIFAMGLHVYFTLRGKGFEQLSERKWRRWLEDPSARRGPIGRLLDQVADAPTVKDTAIRFEELRKTEVSPLERDLTVMKICVGAAPLLGLLGTVMGMLATFSALATGTGGDKTMNLVAGGISEALVTTETGLVIAIPGLFFQYQMQRKQERYKAFLSHLETTCAQAAYRRQQAAAEAMAASGSGHNGDGNHAHAEEHDHAAVS